MIITDIDIINKLKETDIYELEETFRNERRESHYGIRNEFYSNITRISLINMYAYVAISLYDNDLLDKKYKNDIENMRTFLSKFETLKSPNKYSKIPDDLKKSFRDCKNLCLTLLSVDNHISNYINIFLKKLDNNHNNLIILSDCFNIYLNINLVEYLENPLLEINNYEHDVTSIEYMYIISGDTYCTIDNNYEYDINCLNGTTSDRKLLSNMIKVQMRNIKINNLLK